MFHKQRSCLRIKRCGSASPVSMTTKKAPPKKTTTIDRLFLRLGPDDVVRAVKRHEHQTSILGFAGEPVHGFAGHHGKAAGAKRRFCHARSEERRVGKEWGCR